MQGICATAQILKLNNNHIIEMVGSASRIRPGHDQGADADYRLGPADVAKLKDAGVSNRLIQAMTERMAKGNAHHQQPCPSQSEKV